MARLLVGVPSGTGFGTETLAIQHHSLNYLHLAGATRAGTGNNGRHHVQSVDFYIGENSRFFQKHHIFPTQIKHTR